MAKAWISMVELGENIPFLWRLSSETKDGLCVVSMVVPFLAGTSKKEHTIETSVLSFSPEGLPPEEEEILEWNQDDISLFLKLIAHKYHERKQVFGDTVRVDLTDPDTIDIIHVVAAAGFGMAFTADSVLAEPRNDYSQHAYDIGSTVSLSTVGGYKRCIVVDIEGDDVVCVMLEEVNVMSPGEYDKLSRHDLLLVKKSDVLHPEFTSKTPNELDVLH